MHTMGLPPMATREDDSKPQFIPVSLGAPISQAMTEVAGLPKPLPAAYHSPITKACIVPVNTTLPPSTADRSTSAGTSASSEMEDMDSIDEKKWQYAHAHRHSQRRSQQSQQSHQSPRQSHQSPRQSHQSHRQSQRQSHASNIPKTTRDPEKASTPAMNPPTRLSNTAMSIPYSEDDDDSLGDVDQIQARKAVKILLFLSGPCVALSFVNMIWAVAALLIAVVLQPFRLCTTPLSFPQELRYLLVPALNVQLRSIYTPLPPHTIDAATFNASWLLIVHIFAPILSLGNAIAAWTVALYWFLARIVGDPSGMDRRDDGVEAVLGLRRWWESWLLKGVKHA